MKSSLLLTALYVSWTAGFAFNTYDLGLQGIYPRQSFHSVDFQAPSPKVTRWDSRCDYGNLLLTPRGPSVMGLARGPVMLDAKGSLMWMDNGQFEQVINLRVQQYKGEDYLTFWTKHKKHKNNKIPKKHKGEKGKIPKKSYVMLNSAYEIVHRIVPHGKGRKGDSHEFRITPQGTALITIYYKHQVDCTGLKLGKKCWVQDGLFQEIDIETGELIFEWRATDHIRFKDVFSKPNRKDGYGTSKKDAFDFFHINSVDKLDSGDYLISARYMHAVVCVSGNTGDVLWQLGGKHNDFVDLDHATDFSWQHHVEWQGNNTISLFDNHANNVFHSANSRSKGMLIHLDMDNMTASVVQTYVHPDGVLNVSQGSVQVIPKSGNVLVGFGNSPSYVEYNRDGKVLCNAHFGPHLIFEILDFGLVKSYRVFKYPWVGRPKTLPDVKVKHGKLYVSWNGATEVRWWRLETARTRDSTERNFGVVQELDRDGFETSFHLNRADRYVRVAALDANKNELAHSLVVRAPNSVLMWSTLIFILCVTIFVFGSAGLAIAYWRFLWPMRFPTKADLKAWKDWARSAIKGTPQHDPEAEPLLLGPESSSQEPDPLLSEAEPLFLEYTDEP